MGDMTMNDGSAWNDGTGYDCIEHSTDASLVVTCGPYGLSDEPTAEEACCGCGGGIRPADEEEVGAGDDDGPVAAPYAAPYAAPVAAPVAAAEAAPVAAPIAAPIASPVAAPIAGPIAAP